MTKIWTVEELKAAMGGGGGHDSQCIEMLCGRVPFDYKSAGCEQCLELYMLYLKTEAVRCGTAIDSVRELKKEQDGQ